MAAYGEILKAWSEFGLNLGLRTFRVEKVSCYYIIRTGIFIYHQIRVTRTNHRVLRPNGSSHFGF